MGKKKKAKRRKRKRAMVAAPVGPDKGQFVAPPETADGDEPTDALPAQEEFWRPPVRFGSIPVEKEHPLRRVNVPQ